LTPRAGSLIRNASVVSSAADHMPTRPFRIARSTTGLGLFATREIKKKQRIAEYRGRRITTAQAEKMEHKGGNRYMFELNSKWTIDGTPRSNVARYANHSCNPNAEPVIYGGRIFIRALRRIKPEEEITYHYGMDYLRNVIGISNCRCGRCRRRKARKARAVYARKKRTMKRAAARKTKKRRR
jgi:SET domain-containing protein